MLRFSVCASWLLAILSIAIPSLVFSQAITYQLPTGFNVCGEGSFEITVENNTAGALTNVLLTVNFTTASGTDCGMDYVVGTVSGATENNISDLGSPIFQIQNLASGETATITFDASATCGVAQCIDDAEFFVNEITLNWDGGNTSLTTDPYVVTRPLLVVTAVTGTVLSGERGDVLTRTFTITNTRPGPLENFVFTDIFQPGIEISANVGTDISPSANGFQLFIDGTDFISIGDGDIFFEQDESITVIEEVIVTDCGVSLASSASLVTVGWDCDGTAGPGEACQEAPASAIVQFEAFDKTPFLVFEPEVTLPECYCGPGYQQSMTITNTGDAFAENIVLDLSNTVQPTPGFSWPSFIAPGTVGVDSSGTASQNFSVEILATAEPNCPIAEPLADSILVTLPQLGPGESLTVFWDVFYCSALGCKEPMAHWQYRYNYERECYPGIYVEELTYIEVQETGVGISSSLASNAAIDTLYQDDSTYLFQYELNYDSLHLIDDELELTFTVPCGFIWDDMNELLLGGNTPTNISFGQTADDLLVNATYQLPFSSPVANMEFELDFECDSLCNIPEVEGLISSCICWLDPADSVDVSRRVTVGARVLKCTGQPTGCNLCTSASEIYSTDCGPFSTTPIQTPGYIWYDVEASRKNFGLPDNDDNHLPDAGGSLDLSLVRTDRLMTGDTLRVAFKGGVVTDILGSEFPYAHAIVFFNPPITSELGPENFEAMFNPSGIPAVGASARVFDSSDGLWYDCPEVGIAHLPDQGSKLAYRIELAVSELTDCGLPSGFLFAEGDSICVDADFHINYNIMRDNAPDVDPLSAPIVVEPRMIIEAYEDSLTVHCFCAIAPVIEVTGYEYSLANANLALPLCETSNYAGGTQLRVRLNEGNFFPFEYRPLALIEQLKVTLPPEISLAETRLTLLRYQDEFSNIAGPEILTPSTSGSTYIFDLGQFQNGFLDEGYQALIQYRFDTDCALSDIQTLDLCATFDFADQLPELIDPLDFVQSFDVLNPLDPQLEFFTPLPPVIVLPNNQLVLDFEIENDETNVGSQSSGPAPNTWIYVNAPDLTNVQVFNVTTGSFLPSANGVFQVGDLPVGTTDFQILATNNSCEEEILELRYGWNCEPFTSILQEACVMEVDTFRVISPPGELDFFVESPSDCADLCDTIGYHSLEIFNAELGAVYGLVVTAQMPPGFNVLTGSTEVEWPTGSGNIFPIGDPVDLGGGVFEWNISELLDTLSTGLPSVVSAPQNSLTFRFLGETDCDFLAGAFGLFTVAGEQNCGTPTNTVAKPGEPISINGVSAPYTTNIDMAAMPDGCADEVDFTISLLASEELPLGACIVVTLPPGVGYMAGSCASDCQADFNCQPTVDGSTITWQLPEGTAQGDEICFHFTSENWSSLDCGNGTVLVRTANETQAFCALTGDTCSTKVNTGSLIFPYQIERPDFSLENFTATVTPSGGNDLVSYSIDVTNSGLENAPPFLLDFLLDTDGNGTGDLLVTTENFPTSIPNGVTETLTGSLEIPSGNLCGLIAAVSSEQCLCAPDSLAIGLPIIYETGFSEVVCSGEEITVGVSAQPGFSYQWLPDDCLISSNSATTVFTCENNGSIPDIYDFTLVASDGFCEINYHLDVTVQPLPGILFVGSPVCAGEETNILASPGVTYVWSGPNVAQGVQNQVIMPVVTSTYSVTVTDAEGCSGSAETTVEVLPAPSANAGVDTTFCPGTAANLNAVFEAGLNYEWSPGPPVLSSSTSPNPDILVLENQVFTLTVTDPVSGCSTTDEVAVTFGDLLQINVASDLTICLGGGTNLMASGAQTYTWSPDVDCQNPPTCSNVVVTPTQTTTYMVSGVDAAGCQGTGSATVTVVDNSIVTIGDTLELCDGETIELFGQTVSEPGDYAGTFPLDFGCDSTHIIPVVFAPPIPPTIIDTTICENDSVTIMGEVFSEEGVYDFNLQSVDGCDSLILLNLEVLDTALVFLTDSMLPDDYILLSVVPPTFDSILWFGGNITGDCMNEPECEDLVIGEPTYSVTVFSENGCPSTGTIQPLVFPPCEPEDAVVPNVFTPNGDGINDVFTIATPGDEIVFHMEIWNRWGQKVYEGSGPWLGDQKGEPADSDVYIYLIEVGCTAEVMRDEKNRIKGDVTLLR